MNIYCVKLKTNFLTIILNQRKFVLIHFQNCYSTGVFRYVKFPGSFWNKELQLVTGKISLSPKTFRYQQLLSNEEIIVQLLMLFLISRDNGYSILPFLSIPCSINLLINIFYEYYMY